jgi:hypothetical protein
MLNVPSDFICKAQIHRCNYRAVSTRTQPVSLKHGALAQAVPDACSDHTCHKAGPAQVCTFVKVRCPATPRECVYVNYTA